MQNMAAVILHKYWVLLEIMDATLESEAKYTLNSSALALKKKKKP